MLILLALMGGMYYFNNSTGFVGRLFSLKKWLLSKNYLYTKSILFALSKFFSISFFKSIIFNLITTLRMKMSIFIIFLWICSKTFTVAFHFLNNLRSCKLTNIRSKFFIFWFCWWFIASTRREIKFIELSKILFFHLH